MRSQPAKAQDAKLQLRAYEILALGRCAKTPVAINECDIEEGWSSPLAPSLASVFLLLTPHRSRSNASGCDLVLTCVTRLYKHVWAHLGRL